MPLEHQHLGDRIGFDPSHGRRKLQSEQAGGSQRLHRFGSERGELFALGAGLLERLADLFDSAEQHLALGLAIGRESSDPARLRITRERPRFSPEIAHRVFFPHTDSFRPCGRDQM